MAPEWLATDEPERAAFWAQIEALRERRGGVCPHSLPQEGQLPLGRAMFCVWCGAWVGEQPTDEEEDDAPW